MKNILKLSLVLMLVSNFAYAGAINNGGSGGGSGTVNSGTQYQLGYYSANGTAISGNPNLTTSSGGNLYISAGQVGIGTTATNSPLTIGSPAFNDTAGTTGIQLTGNINNFYQQIIQNNNAGASASADLVIGGNDMTASVHYLDIGKNGSAGAAAPFTAADAAYVYTIDNELDIGAQGAAGVINFATGATPTTQMTIGTTTITENLAVTNTTSITSPLIIGGTGAASTLTLESTSGAGTTDAIIYKTGSQVEVMRNPTGGGLSIGTTTLGTNAKLAVNGGATFGTYGGNSTAAPSNGINVSGVVNVGTTGSAGSAMTVATAAATTAAIFYSGTYADPFGGVAKGLGMTMNGSSFPIDGIAVLLNGSEGGNLNAYGISINNTTTVSGTGVAYGIYVTAPTNYFSGTASIGTTTIRNSAALDVQGKINTSGTIYLQGIVADTGLTDATVCEDTTNHQLFSGSGTLGICLGTSSKRYKNPIGFVTDGLRQIMELQPVNFTYKNGYGDNGAKEQYGFYAEDVVKVLPKLTGLDKDGRPNTVDMLGMFPIMVKALQQQQSEIDDLKKQIGKRP